MKIIRSSLTKIPSQNSSREIILPNVIAGEGAVFTKDVEPYTIADGIPT